MIAEQGIAPVHELGHLLNSKRNAPGVEMRCGLFFCGSFHDEDSPNFDSMKWMVEEIWPIIRAEMPEAELTITGHCAQHVPLQSLIKEADGIQYLGRVKSLSDYMDKARCFVAPTRYAGGIPHKVHEAMAAGLPVVCTNLLRRQLSTTEIGFTDVPVFSSATDEPEMFAQACLDILQNNESWQELQVAGFDFVDATASDQVFSQQLRDIIRAL